jgi:upstream activation factor subunit UAF30
MARTTKTTKATDNVSVITTASTAAPVADDKASKASKKTKSADKSADAKSVSSAKPEVSVKQEVKCEQPVCAEESADAVCDGIAEFSNEFLAKLNHINSLVSTLKTEYRALEKKWTRELKTAQKLCSKRKRKSGNRAPSGFVKPTKISDELAKFLDKPIGSEMARTEVTRDINKYIRSNNLQDSENGRKINADSKLASLLKLKKNDELTYFNLQRYMSPHFAKASTAPSTSA